MAHVEKDLQSSFLNWEYQQGKIGNFSTLEDFSLTAAQDKL